MKGGPSNIYPQMSTGTDPSTFKNVYAACIYVLQNFIFTSFFFYCSLREFSLYSNGPNVSTYYLLLSLLVYGCILLYIHLMYAKLLMFWTLFFGFFRHGIIQKQREERRNMRLIATWWTRKWKDGVYYGAKKMYNLEYFILTIDPQE